MIAPSSTLLQFLSNLPLKQLGQMASWLKVDYCDLMMYKDTLLSLKMYWENALLG